MSKKFKFVKSENMEGNLCVWLTTLRIDATCPEHEVDR